MKRYFLLFATNLLIVIVLSIIMAFLGIDSTSWFGFFILCLLFGMGGALINLQLSIWFAKKFHGVKVINNQSEKLHDKQDFVLKRTNELCRKVGLSSTQVGIYESQEVMHLLQDLQNQSH